MILLCSILSTSYEPRLRPVHPNFRRVCLNGRALQASILWTTFQYGILSFERFLCFLSVTSRWFRCSERMSRLTARVGNLFSNAASLAAEWSHYSVIVAWKMPTKSCISPQASKVLSKAPSRKWRDRLEMLRTHKGVKLFIELTRALHKLEHELMTVGHCGENMWSPSLAPMTVAVKTQLCRAGTKDDMGHIL